MGSRDAGSVMSQDRDTPIMAAGYTNPRCIHAQADSVPGVTGRAVAIADHEPERLSVAEVHDQVGCLPRAKSLSAGVIHGGLDATSIAASPTGLERWRSCTFLGGRVTPQKSTRLNRRYCDG